MPKMQNNRFIELVTLSLLAILEGFTHFGAWHGDSINYVSITHIFMGTATPLEATTAHWHGFLRPIAPILAAPLSFVLETRTAIATVNLSFLVIGTVFTYLLVSRLLNNDLFGFMAGLFYASATPNLIWGVAILTDGPGYAMLAVGYYWLICHFKPNLKISLLTGFLLTFCLLVKETNIILIAYLGIQWLSDSGNRRKNLPYYVLPVLMAALVTSLWMFVAKISYLDFFNIGIEYAGGYSSPLLQPKVFISSVIRAFYVLLPFACIGLFQLLDREMKQHLRILLSGLALIIPWSSMPDPRYTFILYPSVISMAVIGVNHASQTLANWSWFRSINKQQWNTIFVFTIIACLNLIALKYAFPK